MRIGESRCGPSRVRRRIFPVAGKWPERPPAECLRLHADRAEFCWRSRTRPCSNDETAWRSTLCSRNTRPAKGRRPPLSQRVCRGRPSEQKVHYRRETHVACSVEREKYFYDG